MAAARALVTDVQLRNAVAGLRALGRAGVEVVAVGPSRRSAGLWSRHTSMRRLAPDVMKDPKGFAAAVLAVARELAPVVIYPGREEAIDPLLAQAESLPPQVRLPYPAPEVVQALRDKRRLPAVLSESGLKSPRTLASGAAAELASLLPSPPLAVKPAAPGGALDGTRIVRSREELRSLLLGLPPQDPLLLQEHVTGVLTSLELVLDRGGGVVACFQHEVRRTWPAAAGGIVWSVSVPPDESLVSRAASALANAGYHGLIQLQMIARDAAPVVIDANPRFYGPLPLSLAAGVNLPAAWHAVATGTTPAALGQYRVGVTYRRLEADFRAAFRGSPRLLLRRAPRPRAGAMWAADDPLPGALLGTDALAAPIRRRVVRPK